MYKQAPKLTQGGGGGGGGGVGGKSILDFQLICLMFSYLAYFCIRQLEIAFESNDVTLRND